MACKKSTIRLIIRLQPLVEEGESIRFVHMICEVDARFTSYFNRLGELPDNNSSRAPAARVCGVVSRCCRAGSQLIRPGGSGRSSPHQRGLEEGYEFSRFPAPAAPKELPLINLYRKAEAVLSHAHSRAREQAHEARPRARRHRCR